MHDHCQHCPVPDGLRCASEGHARYCDLAAREAGRPGYWADSIRRRSAGMDAAPPSGYPGPDPGDGRVSVGLAFPVCYRGGAEEWTRQVAASIDPRRVRVSGLAILHGRDAVDPSVLPAFEALAAVRFGLDAGLRLAGMSDVILGWDMGELPARIPRAAGRPKVVLVSHSPPQSGWGIEAMRKLDGVDRLVAVSELARETIPAERRSSADVIWNAVDDRRLARVSAGREEKRRGWGVPPGARVAGFLGRLSSEKRADMMVRLARSLPEPWHVVVVGSGPESSGLTGAMPPNFHHAEADPEAGDCLRAFDVGVVPSDYESFCLTLAEMIWLRLPVVSTDVGIARLHPGITRLVPFKADGLTLARAVLEAHAGGPTPAAEAYLPSLSPDRFGRDWTDLICSTARPPEPTLPQKAASFAKAVARHVAAGCPTRTEERQAELKAICLSCEHQRGGAATCAVCGCSRMDWKRSMRQEKCPVGKWPEDGP